MQSRNSAVTPGQVAKLSLLLSFITIAIVLWINFQIAERFELATGKTRALFGITELQYNYKYYFAIGGLIALILAFRSARRL